MALNVTSDSTTLTAPSLLGMASRGAAALAAALVAAMGLSAWADLRGVQSPALLAVALGIAALGVVGVLRVRSDPVSARPAALIVATGPLACSLTCMAIPGPPGHPNQLNALGAGIVVCAFMCIRGRILVAWMAFAAMVAVLGTWSLATGQGVYGFALADPNLAVVGMATLFAVVVRPAADVIREQNQQSIREAQALAAANARAAERDERRAELRRVAWPILRHIASGQRFSGDEVDEVVLTEAQLRDGVRARAMALPHVVTAVRDARSRGVEVVVFDDGVDSAAASTHRMFCDLAVEWLGRVDGGSVTLRLHPPGRPVTGSIVVVSADGTSQRVDVDATGEVHGP